MFAQSNSTSSPLPAVKTAGVGIISIVERFIIPIAGFMAGVTVGFETAIETARFITSFVPGVDRATNWVNAITFKLHLQMIIAGVVLLFIATKIDLLFTTFLGDFTITRMAARGAMAFVFGVAVRAIIIGFEPLQVAMDAVGTALPEAPEEKTIPGGGIISEKELEERAKPGPGGDRGRLILDGRRRGGGGGEPFTDKDGGKLIPDGAPFTGRKRIGDFTVV